MPLWCFSVLSSRFFKDHQALSANFFFLSHHSTNGNWYNLFIKTIRYRRLCSDSLVHRSHAGIFPALAVTHSFVLWRVSLVRLPRLSRDKLVRLSRCTATTQVYIPSIMLYCSVAMLYCRVLLQWIAILLIQLVQTNQLIQFFGFHAPASDNPSRKFVSVEVIRRPPMCLCARCERGLG